MSLVSRVIGRRWKLPAPIHRKIKIEEVRTPMRDGVELVARHYHSPGAGPRPTVLVRSCYGISGPFGLLGTLFAERGFQVILQNCRGIGESQGVFRPFLDEQNDGEDTVEWIAQQPWFNGDLALWGISYLGNTAWAIANSPAGAKVKAMGLHVTLTNFHDRTYAYGGFTLLGSIGWTITMFEVLRSSGMNIFSTITRMRRSRVLTEKAVAVIPLKNADRVISPEGLPWWRNWMNHAEPGDAWWDSINYGRAAATIPSTVMTAGWHDIFLPWQLRDFMNAQEAGRDVRLIAGPWMHANPDAIAESMRESIALFQERFGITTPKPGKPRVRLFLLGANSWREYPSWPIPTATPQTFFFQEGGILAAKPPGDSAVSTFDYNPADPTPSLYGPTIEGKNGSGDMAELERRADTLVFTSAPLANHLDAIGPITAEVYLRSSTEYTDVYLCLCDVNPAALSTNVCDGYRRLRPGDATLMADGRTRKVAVEFWPTAYRFQAGHRLRVIVASGAHPRYVRNLGSGEPLGEAQKMIVAHQEILHGPEHPTAITLAVVPPIS